jgi:hypothetical protein
VGQDGELEVFTILIVHEKSYITQERLYSEKRKRRKALGITNKTQQNRKAQRSSSSGKRACLASVRL